MDPTPGSKQSVACQHELLTRSGVGSVSVCQGCGQVHLELQNFTVRFEEAAFLELARMVRRAQQRLDGQAAPAAPRQARTGLH
jgi:hypothetical protein